MRRALLVVALAAFAPGCAPTDRWLQNADLITLKPASLEGVKKTYCYAQFEQGCVPQKIGKADEASCAILVDSSRAADATLEYFGTRDLASTDLVDLADTAKTAAGRTIDIEESIWSSGIDVDASRGAYYNGHFDWSEGNAINRAVREAKGLNDKLRALDERILMIAAKDDRPAAKDLAATMHLFVGDALAPTGSLLEFRYRTSEDRRQIERDETALLLMKK